MDCQRKLNFSAKIPGVIGVGVGEVGNVATDEGSSVGLVGIVLGVDEGSVGLVGSVLTVEGSSVGLVEDAAVEGPADVGMEVGVPMQELGDSMMEEEKFSFYVFLLLKLMAPHCTPNIV